MVGKIKIDADTMDDLPRLLNDPFYVRRPCDNSWSTTVG
jgi:hypothetical protein